MPRYRVTTYIEETVCIDADSPDRAVEIATDAEFPPDELIVTSREVVEVDS